MLEKLSKTYSGKKVFLTGHTGFKGAWMLKVLGLLGAEVKGYALEPNTPDDIFHYVKGSMRSASVLADIRDKKRLESEILSFEPDFVFHLAAQPLVRLSYQIPQETFEVNAIGTANVLDAVRLLHGKCQVVLITTDKVYHNNEWTYPYRENDRLGGYDPYSASKACAELIIDSYRNSFFNTKEYDRHGKAIAVARAGNVIGGGDWSKDRLIPDIIQALSAGREIIVRNPDSVRPWQHVMEPVGGYLLLGDKLSNDPIAYSQPFNFGPYMEDTLFVEDVVKTAVRHWQNGQYRVESGINQPHEAGLLKLDISKATSELGWKPRFNAETAIAETVLWYKTFLSDKKSIEKFTESQIEKFLS